MWLPSGILAEGKGGYLFSKGTHVQGLHSLGWGQIARAVDTFWIPTRTEFHPEAPEETEAAGLSLEPGTSAAQPLATYFITWEVSQQLYNAVMEAELPVA